jgi:hypothetical protein
MSVMWHFNTMVGHPLICPDSFIFLEFDHFLPSRRTRQQHMILTDSLNELFAVNPFPYTYLAMGYFTYS